MPKLILAAATTLLLGANTLHSEDLDKYGDVQFTYSDDPAAVVLFVNVLNLMANISHSATLYGDGRIELQVRHAGTNTLMEEYEITITSEKVHALLREVVHHGLAEWDGASVHARQLRLTSGHGYASPSDSLRVAVVLALDSYSRASYSQKNIERTIRVRGPSHGANLFPEIVELEGVKKLQVWAMTLIQGEQEKKQ